MDDVVDAVLAAAEGHVNDGSIFHIVDPARFTQNDVLRLAVGPAARVIRVPRTIVFGLGKLSEILLAPLRRRSPLSLYRLRSALALRTFGSERARCTLGWTPRVGAARGIAQVLKHRVTEDGGAAAVGIVAVA
jgi:nucleoside-diphosphate-sugar epimerase